MIASGYSYRAVRLKLVDPENLAALSVRPIRAQPDANQTNRGTVYMRCWEGDGAPAVTPGMTMDLIVQRDPDPGTPIDEPVPFGLAVTLAMPGVVGVYEQIRQRLAIPQQQRA